MGSAVSAATLPDHAASRGDAERLAGHAECAVPVRIFDRLSIVPRSIRALQMCKICIARHQNDYLEPLLDGKLDRIAGG
jgi:hypothetical protein